MIILQLTIEYSFTHKIQKNHYSICQQGIVIEMDSSNQQQRLHEDAAASVAPTPARKCVKDFFQKISTDEYIKNQNDQIMVLSQAVIMDLRSVQVRAKKRSAKKRCVVRSPNESEGSAHCF